MGQRGAGPAAGEGRFLARTDVTEPAQSVQARAPIPDDAWEYQVRKSLNDAAYNGLDYVADCPYMPVDKECEAPRFMWVRRPAPARHVPAKLARWQADGGVWAHRRRRQPSRAARGLSGARSCRGAGTALCAPAARTRPEGAAAHLHRRLWCGVRACWVGPGPHLALGFQALLGQALQPL